MKLTIVLVKDKGLMADQRSHRRNVGTDLCGNASSEQQGSIHGRVKRRDHAHKPQPGILLLGDGTAESGVARLQAILLSSNCNIQVEKKHLSGDLSCGDNDSHQYLIGLFFATLLSLTDCGICPIMCCRVGGYNSMLIAKMTVDPSAVRPSFKENMKLTPSLVNGNCSSHIHCCQVLISKADCYADYCAQLLKLLKSPATDTIHAVVKKDTPTDARNPADDVTIYPCGVHQKYIQVMERFKDALGLEPCLHNSTSHSVHLALIQKQIHHRNLTLKTTTRNSPAANNRPSCTNTPSPHLDSLVIHPPLNLTPNFNSSRYEYFAKVPYHTVILRLSASTVSCHTEARLEHKFGATGPLNFTLGLGVNRFQIYVVDTRHSEPWIQSTYTLFFRRIQRGITFTPNKNLHACHYTQDCQLRFDDTLPCDLQETGEFWRDLASRDAQSPHCQDGHHQGVWRVPCGSCLDEESCVWNDAIWTPYTCKYARATDTVLKNCLAGRQILFIGDSTNRGIMHYLMERVNGSLLHWHKTHDIKVYTNLNARKTNVSFAYYPRFWLPSDARPVFDKTLHQLFIETFPLENSHRTVLVVGGVRWISTHHLNVIRAALKRVHLEKILVIIKTLGAGFHQAVKEPRNSFPSDPQKLHVHDLGLISYAQAHGFHVLDTFNMTMARHKDFLQGQCACHFHRIKETLPLIYKINSTTDIPIEYHVEGEINAEYSEILFNLICQN
ncbi:hypothetical protein CAPTEDRAFT_217127 [Capitella teleta]|uniref:NXPE C-terminal domain-containing protein n=1 Tax=Capitella teleta TaxID=283909 RepID=R7VEP8_CAPTE|nr:hypothetical protein CAPTEDRAFT_217127 [Capitella teleta]|eukprot:ELU17104.1 hypothetical protein CAPTEDRAFT_217127 [Capitella teleta]